MIDQLQPLTYGEQQRLLEHPRETPQLTPDVALRALVFAQGNPALAAERLGLRHADELLGVLVLDESSYASLAATLRMYQTIRLMGAADTLLAHVLEHIEDMSPAEAARSYTSMIASVAELTKVANAVAHTQNITQNNVNVTETMLKLLPPDARRAMQALIPLSEDDLASDGAPAARVLPKLVAAANAQTPTADDDDE